MDFTVSPRTHYHVECWRPDPFGYRCFNGIWCRRVWTEDFHNLVTTEGKNKLLDAGFKSGIGAAAWYIGVVDNAGFSAYAAGDTAASHAGWTELTAYDEATRQSLVTSTPAAGSTDNSANRGVFTANATKTARGCFLSTSNVKGGGAGSLYGVGDFTVARSVIAGDPITVQVTLSL
jgi:hypothetical protein